MDENQKINLKFFIKQFESDPIIKVFCKDSVKRIFNTPEEELNDRDYLQCLQELSKTISLNNRIKEYIDSFVVNLHTQSVFLCFRGKYQYYFFQGSNIQSACSQFFEIIKELDSFVKTQCLDGREVCDEVYENFLDMLDSLSVCPKKDFMKAWSKILHYYNQIPPVVSSDLNETGPSPTFLTLLSCFKHIKNFENGSF